MYGSHNWHTVLYICIVLQISYGDFYDDNKIYYDLFVMLLQDWVMYDPGTRIFLHGMQALEIE